MNIPLKKYLFILSIIQIVSTNANPQKNSIPAAKIIEQRNIPTTLLHATNTDDILRSFLQPIQFTRWGINDFFTTIFNSSLYSERFLGSCFVHVIDFLEHGKQNNKPSSYYESVFLLFHHRLKENNWVNPYALLIFLEQIPECIGYMPEQTHAQRINILRDELEQAVADLKKEQSLRGQPPLSGHLQQQKNNAFYTQTAERLLAKLDKIEQDGNFRDVQKSLVLLLESALSKVIFNPKEHETIWKTITLLAQKCEHLYNLGCLTSSDDLNRLLWSLLYRFGYYVECMGQQMPLLFYQNIRESLITDPVLFLHREEQEEWLTKKMDYLNSVLSKGEILTHAYTQGILADR